MFASYMPCAVMYKRAFSIDFRMLFSSLKDFRKSGGRIAPLGANDTGAAIRLAYQ